MNSTVEYSFKVSPAYWTFILGNDRVLQAVNKESAGARTFVRLVYKAFEMGLPYETDGIDPTCETLAKSHAEKIEKMKDWPESPFCHMKLESSNNVYRLKKLIRSEKCDGCKTKTGNKACALKMCKSCCNSQTEKSCTTHKTKQAGESS